MNSKLPAEYFDTVFRIPNPPDPIPGNFVIITAYNPMDELSSPEDNDASDQALRALLETEGLISFRATGASPDMSHTEPGWAFSTHLSQALRIAQKFRQRALWWIEDHELHLVDCSNPTPIAMGRFADRISRS